MFKNDNMDASVILNFNIHTPALIVLVSTTPFLLFTIRNIMLSKASKHWTKINGMITTTEEFQLGAKFRLHYEYSLGDHTFTSRRIFYSNTTTYSKRLAEEFEQRYSKYQIVNVFYNPKNPKQSVLEPGRTDGAFLIIGVLGVLFLLSVLAIFFPNLYNALIDVLTRLFN
ncbi:DUF3592 domain-containing protein [Gelidibacter pelagius]|uniref:DUF3592 domain-containing protein n=1 Tax=Gelidibacter pelagius TaxID=2819985 RepID=A0ABS3STW2_9FLAO|nr:DUF3592 domain-containing protein [Gelidibacter pelagius]MBO3099163.1 DUF3592 domain-containing protein [Gelidibacter pelagius]